ncbi:PstS family phosphate ABC transporter substrate-binding protein [Holophaga foetida]|uniref:PstS family phosphate ABC transporter substrate-binding protein n=1 Tax=Holophaga foetida TaxID=35839 RepID=UPI003CC73C1E
MEAFVQKTTNDWSPHIWFNLHNLFGFLSFGLLMILGVGLRAQAPVGKTLVATGGECLMYAVSLWGDAYKSKDPSFSMEVRVSGEDKGLEDLTEGSVQMAMIARDAVPDELAAFREKWGYLPTRIAVAMDALVVAVNRENPVKGIRIEQIDAIMTTNRGMGWPKDILTWADLGVVDPRWAQRKIVRYGRSLDSSVFGLIAHFFPHQMETRMPITILPDGMAMAEALASDPDGFCMANLVEDFSSLRTLPVYPSGTDYPVQPTPDSVSSGAYPYSRCLYLYVNKHPKKGLEPRLKAFLEFALSPEGQKLVKAAGQAPLSRDIQYLNQFKVTDGLHTDAKGIR